MGVNGTPVLTCFGFAGLSTGHTHTSSLCRINSLYVKLMKFTLYSTDYS